MTDTLTAGQSLAPNGKLISTDGGHELVFQADGNLVVYNTKTGKATWYTGTNNAGSNPPHVCLTLIMQGDGNLVIYGNVTRTGLSWKPPHPPVTSYEAIWNSQTGNRPGSYVVMQSDGNLVMYQPEIVPVWQSHTNT